MTSTPEHPTPALAPVQAQVILALAQGSTITAAAKAAGLHRSTVYEWRKSIPQFEDACYKAHQEYVVTLFDEHTEAVRAAFTRLRDLLDSPNTPPAVVLKAALVILDHPSFHNLSWDISKKTAPAAAPAQPPAEPARQNPTQSDTFSNSAVPPTLQPAPTPKIGRNEPCPCGSGRKFKHCCLGTTANPALRAQAAASGTIDK